MTMNDVGKNALRTLLDRQALLRMAGTRSYERGEDYFVGGCVGSLIEHEGRISAKVFGTRQYRAKLWAEEDNLAYSCDCPIGVDGAFCKHCVAVGLAFMEQQRSGSSNAGKQSKPSLSIDDVREYLASQKKNFLVDMLMEQALEDDRLLQRLFMKAAKECPGGIDLSTYRRSIDQTVHPDEFVDYRGMYDYARNVCDVIDSVEELLKEGHAVEVIELAEHALAAVEEAMGSVDDSDGRMGGILERLQELHLEACRKARPDPEELARRLFEWELRSGWDTFHGAAETYAGVLGAKGLAVYRQLAEAEWKLVPALTSAGKDADSYGKRFRITSIMEALARLTGDVQAVVAVKERDLSSAYSYLQIAETYKQAGKHDLALEWAERGIAAFPQRPDSRLREFLAVEYHRRKRHDEAMALIWAEYSESPGLDRYRNLKSHADRIDRWPQWRERAVACLREQIAKWKKEAGRNSWGWTPRRDHSELVRIFLWEKNVEDAWLEAKEGGCSNDLWLELAAKIEKQRPGDALPIYQAQIEPTLNRKSNEAYLEAVVLLRKVRALMVLLAREAEFDAYLASVRAAHKPKRNFMKLLERTKWK